MALVEKEKKKLDFDKVLPERDKDFESWLGKELIEKGNKILNNCPSKEELIVQILIMNRNWELALGEIKKLEAQIQILMRGK